MGFGMLTFKLTKCIPNITLTSESSLFLIKYQLLSSAKTKRGEGSNKGNNWAKRMELRRVSYFVWVIMPFCLVWLMSCKVAFKGHHALEFCLCVGDVIVGRACV